MILWPFATLLFIATASAKRLSDSEIVALEANHKAAANKAEDDEAAAMSRAAKKRMYVEEVMATVASRKRALVEAEAEEWLETIQQAKRAVHRSMGIENIEPRNDGLWQGDIILRRSEAEDIILRHGGQLPAHRRVAAEKRRTSRSVLWFDADTSRRWKSPIPYTFDATISDPKIQARIKQNIAKIAAAVPCLTFNEVKNPNPKSYFMRFYNEEPGKRACGGSAFIGMADPEQVDDSTGKTVGNGINIQFGDDYCDKCFIDTMIVHEIFHALGMSHEQCRGDRDSWITIDFANVIPSMANNYEVDSNASFTPYGQPYHYDSVMHYKSKSLALDKTKAVMKAKVAPIDANTAKMGNNTPVCGAVESDWVQLRKAYCTNPPDMTAPLQYTSNKVGTLCFSSVATCNSAATKTAEPTCPSGFSASGPSAVGCFPCTGSKCFDDQAGDNWVATAYRAQIHAAGRGSTCPASSSIMGLKTVKCMSSTACGDSDVMCGMMVVGGSKCSDPAFERKCQKTCGTGPCAAGAGK